MRPKVRRLTEITVLTVKLGLSDEKVHAIVQTAWASGEGCAFEHELDVELPEPIPELREYRDDEDQI